MKIQILTKDERSSSTNKNLEMKQSFFLAEIRKFAKKEWRKWDLEHYGLEEVDFDIKNIFFKALENEKLVGFLELSLDQGVGFVQALLVQSDMQGKGIGKQLLKKAEKAAKEAGCHKIQLHTGANWKERAFYEKMGFKKTNDLPDQYMRRDFVEYTKYLS